MTLIYRKILVWGWKGQKRKGEMAQYICWCPFLYLFYTQQIQLRIRDIDPVDPKHWKEDIRKV